MSGEPADYWVDLYAESSFAFGCFSCEEVLTRRKLSERMKVGDQVNK